MSHRCLLMILLCLFVSQPAAAGEATSLAECTIRVFNEIGKTAKWSGKLQEDCPHISVERRSSGVFVTAWDIELVDGGWIRTAFTGAMGLAEIADKNALVVGSRDIRTRAERLERCLESITTVNDPLECRDRAVKTYQAGEAGGTETARLIWLDDGGRHAIIEYAFGTTSATPTQPTELFNGTPLLPGVIIDLRSKR